MDKPVAAAPTGAKEKVEKQARQLAYDVRYKTKQSLAQKSGGKMDPAQVQKAYMSQLAKSPAPPAVKSRAKQMLMGEDYKSDLGRLVSNSAASALYKVFVEHHQKDANGNVIPHEGEEINEEEKSYKVRVTDKKTSNSYVRMATRSKIAELRSNPNISSVEMTEYGSPTKSEKYKGKQTADAKKGKLAKKDYDGDGKIETGTQEYMGSKDKAIKKAMATRKEEYSWRDGFAELIEKKDKEEKKITGEGVNNKKLIKVFPDDVKEMYGSAAGTGATMAKPESAPAVKKPDPQIASKEKKQAMLKKQVLMKKLQAVRAGAGSDITSSYEPEKKLTEGEDATPEMPSDLGDITFDAGGAIPTTIKAIGDPREIETAMKLKKTQLRASGLNMSHEPEGDMVEAKVDKGMIFGKSLARNERKFGKKGSTTPQGYFGQKPSQAAELSKKRTDEHKAKRGVKTKGMGEAYEVTNSDKKANTKAYQDMKAGKKNQITGEPLYKKADHMNENLVTIENLNNVSNINVKPSAYKSEKDVIKDILNNKADVAYENRQVAMEPEKHKDPDESDKPYRQRSRAARMRDPKRGINSPAFKKFMADRGM